MKKKILASLLAVVAIFVCIAFTACDDKGGDKNNYSETYKGTLSAEYYANANDAAEAFIANEIDSEASHATFVSYTATATLTEEEIAKLNLTEEEIADVKSAEKGTIYYTTSTPSVAALSSAPSASGVKSQTIYIVEFNTPSVGGSIKYLAPLPKSGEAVTKSYLESVFNPEYYKNCTESCEMVLTSKGSASGITATMEMSVAYTLRITENAVEMVATTTVKMSVLGQTETQKETVISYLIDSPEGIQQATLYNDYWSVTNYTYSSGIEKIADLFTYNLPDTDYSYLVKTNTGFKIKEEFINNLIEELLSDPSLNAYYGTDFTPKASAEYFVSGGKLDNVKVSLNMGGTVYEDGIAVKTDVSVKLTNKYTNYGTTSFTIPNEAKEALGI